MKFKYTFEVLAFFVLSFALFTWTVLADLNLGNRK